MEKPIFTKRKYSRLDFVGLHIKAVPLHSFFKFALTVVQALMPMFTIISTSGFINTAIAVKGGDAKASDAMIYIALIIGIMAYGRIQGSLWGLNDIAIENRLRKRCKWEMSAIRGEIEYRHIENQSTQDLISRVSSGVDGRINGMYWHVISLARFVIQLASILILVFMQLWWAVIIMLIFCLPLVYIGLRAGKKRYEADKDVTKLDRAAGYFSEVLCSRENIDERFIFGYANEVDLRYQEKYDVARLRRKEVEKKNLIAMKTGSILLIMETGAMAVPLLFATLNKTITLGMTMSLIPAIYNLAQSMSWELNYFLSELSNDREFLNDLTEFMALETVSGSLLLPQKPPLPFENLEFKNVSFRYPGTERFILKDFSLYIEKNRHYAIAGENGAGKTTLTKLITGLYTEYEGDIFINGKNIKTYNPAELKSLCGVVYQDFARYNLTFGENILLGNINILSEEEELLRKHENKDRKTAYTKRNKKSRQQEEVDLESELITDFNSHLHDTKSGKVLNNAVELLALNDAVDKLPNRYDTPLGKIREGGNDLSGGEWQRVAMARAVSAPSGLKILDEPTAALDPISESRIYSEFEKISSDSTTLFISHRLGSTKLADVIFVISEGRVAEQGSHEELIQKKGLYAKMYQAQAEWYTILV